MERISIQEIAAILTEKSGLKKKDAERFATTMFDVVKYGLEADRLVKVKGLGTFKVIDIEARESVNVNTGERVLIEGHGKITFSPDNTMKELVNKPFSQFETVILNEGVDFNDEVVDDVIEDIDDREEEPSQEVVPDVVPEPEPEQEQEIKREEELDPEPIVEEEQHENQSILEFCESKESISDKIQQVEVPAKRHRLLWPLVSALTFVGGLALGYYWGLTNVSNTQEEPAPVVTEVVEDTTDNEVAVIDTVSVRVKQAETGYVADAPAQKVEPARPVAVVESPVAETPKPQPTAAVEEPDVYGQMDARVRLGAYRIVGADYDVKVKAGDNMARIARRTLGPDMECYIEVFNGLKASSELREGQTVKIPKLELKKKKKQNNNK